MLCNHGKPMGGKPYQRAHRVDAHGPDEGIEDALVEVPFPHCHLAHRSGRVPGLLVDSLRGHRVIDIADRAHAGQQRDGIAGQAIRIAGSVDFLVMVQANVLHLGIGSACAQYLRTRRRVTSHDGEFAIRELARLVEHFQWHRGLAEVVHQASDAGKTRLPFVQAELTGQRKHQGADGDRMQVGVSVVGLQPRHAEQSHGMALDRSGDFVDQVKGGAEVDRLAKASVVEHVDDLAFGRVADTLGASDLSGHRGRARYFF